MSLDVSLVSPTLCLPRLPGSRCGLLARPSSKKRPEGAVNPARAFPLYPGEPAREFFLPGKKVWTCHADDGSRLAKMKKASIGSLCNRFKLISRCLSA